MPSRCDYCGKSSEYDHKDAKACSECNLVSYCSDDCQHKAWEKSHKFECRRFDDIRHQKRMAGGRLLLDDPPGASASDCNSALWYTRISRPWIHIFEIYGPYPDASDMVGLVHDSLKFSCAGMWWFEHMRKEYYVHAPLDADGDKEILVEFLTRSDTILKAQLPCPIYNLVCLERSEGTDVEIAQSKFRARSIELLGTFTRLEDAEQALRADIDAQLPTFPGAGSKVVIHNGGLYGSIYKDKEIKRYWRALLEE